MSRQDGEDRDSRRGGVDMGAGSEVGSTAHDLLDLDEEEMRMVQTMGEHPMLQRVQERLQKQLQDRYERATEELREKREDGSRLAEERETLGVDLYSVQQQLAKLQMEVETATSNLEVLAQVRKRAEADLKRFRRGYDEKKEQVEEERARLEEARAELDGINDAVRQVEKYNQDLQGDAALSRRAAYKAEEQATEAETAKRDQDLYIDELNGRINRLKESLAMYESQVSKQKEETAAAESTLRDAEGEMETIRVEKNRLMQQWQSVLLDLRRRDEALDVTRRTLHEQEEEFESMNAEENNVRRLIREAEQAHAKLQEVMDREQGQVEYCESQLETVHRERDAIAERKEMLEASLESADAEVARLRSRADRVQKQIRELERQRGLVEGERQQAESGMAEKEGAQVTARKAAKNLAKDSRKVLELVHEKEREMANLENEMARIDVDSLNAQSHVEALREELQEAEAEVKSKQDLTAKYQLEIRQRNDAIEKKMSIVDRLNRKYEQMVSSLPEEERMGPLHATVKNLTKKVAEFRQSCEELQRQWLSEQTELVALTNDADDKATRAREMKTQRVLLEQKRVRLEAAVQSQAEEAKSLRAGVDRMRKDMSRINALIARNDELKKRLSEGAFSSESEFMEELRELEQASVEAEAQIARAKEEKAQLLEDILEAERQIMLWEKKIQLEKETQKALDPSVGENEVANMEREIHRMRLRLEALKRDEERLVKDLEQVVDRREDMSVRFRTRRKGADPAGNLTRAGAKKRITVLRNQLKKKRQDAEGYVAALESREKEASAKEDEAAAVRAEVEELEQQVDETQAHINAELYDKQRDAKQVGVIRYMASELEEQLQFASRCDPDLVNQEQDVAREESDAIEQMVQELKSQVPDMEDLLQRVEDLLHIVPPL